jgi:hypothetical protein
MYDGDVFRDDRPELIMINSLLEGSPITDSNFIQLDEAESRGGGNKGNNGKNGNNGNNGNNGKKKANPFGPLNIKELGAWKDTADRALRYGPH